MPTQQTGRTYRIYLLTVWQEDEENWRFLVEDPRSGKRQGFAGMEAFTDGLPAIIGAAPPKPSSPADVVDSAPSPGC